jgi:hypothetical protein
VRDGVRQLRDEAAPDRLDAQFPAVGGDPHSARPAPDRKRRLERPCGEVDAVRRQLGDAVRHDRAGEVHRLAAGAAKW